MSENIVSVSDLDVEFITRDGVNPVLNGVDFDLAAGATMGLVGESGSGKSTSVRAALRLLGNSAHVRGRVEVCGVDVYSASELDLRRLRAEKIALIQQDPQSSLNPVRRIGRSMCERLVSVRGADRVATMDKAEATLAAVGIRNPGQCLRQFPHQLSGGMLQRVVIAAGLMADPELIMADEATSALDVSTQAEVLALIEQEQKKRGLSVLFVTHDLLLAASVCDSVAVMNEGSIVETLPGASLFESAQHPYTIDLLEATPILRGAGR